MATETKPAGRDEWCMGFWAAAYLFAGHYDRYAKLRDEYLDDAGHRHPASEADE